MPIKLLVWNIQNFTSNTIDWAKEDQCELSDRFMALFRSTYILDNVTKLDPDIFVVIEVQSHHGKKGSLLPENSLGGQGCLMLLANLKAKNEGWRLVPPLKLVPKTVTQKGDKSRSYLGSQKAIKTEDSYTEAIGVFFRSDRWAFQGPYVWPLSDPIDHQAKVAVPTDGGVETGDYPETWQNALGQDPEGVNNHFAGQFEYFNPRNSQKKMDEIGFPHEGERPPLTTQFLCRDGSEILLTLVSVHFPPPKKKQAGQAYQNTLEYFNGDYPLQEKEIVLVAGDFNIDASGKKKNMYLQSCHIYNFQAGYVRKAPPSMLLPAVSRDEKVILATLQHYKSGTLDNFAFRTGLRIKRKSSWFIDRVKGTKINKELFLPSLMLTKPDILQDFKPEERQNDIFRQEQNYKHLGPKPGTSDHMALYIELEIP